MEGMSLLYEASRGEKHEGVDIYVGCCSDFSLESRELFFQGPDADGLI